MFSHLNPDVCVARNSYEPGYNRNPEVTSVVTERRINPFSPSPSINTAPALKHGTKSWESYNLCQSLSPAAEACSAYYKKLSGTSRKAVSVCQKESMIVLPTSVSIGDNLAARPTSLYKITPSHQLSLLGAQDASGYQMGGVWFPWDPQLLARAVPPLHPILWQASFPEKITALLVSSDNPHGTITNSSLELAAKLVQHDVAAQCFDVRELSLATGSDNTPTVAWATKRSTTMTSSPPTCSG
jgi:hypothetical protein